MPNPASNHAIDVSICVVGVGLCGAAFVAGLARELSSLDGYYGFGWQRRIAINLFDRHRTFGPGTVYDREDTEPEHLLIAPLFSHAPLGTAWGIETWYHRNHKWITEYIKSIFDSRRVADAKTEQAFNNRPQSSGENSAAVNHMYRQRWNTYFERFLRTHDNNLVTSRLVYGLYIAEQLKASLLRLKSLGIAVHEFPETEVQSVTHSLRVQGGYELVCRPLVASDAASFSVDARFLVITTGHWQERSTIHRYEGNLAPDWPTSKVYSRLRRDIETYLASLSRTDCSDRRVRVNVYGSSLTAHDIAKTIQKDGFFITHADFDQSHPVRFVPRSLNFVKQGCLRKVRIDVLFISRSGIFPKIRPLYYPPSSALTNQLDRYLSTHPVKRLASILAIVRSEYFLLLRKLNRVRAVPLRQILRPLEDPFGRLRDEIRSFVSDPFTNEASILMRAIHMPVDLKTRLFEQLLPRDKHRFLKTYRTAFLALDQPFTIEAAQDILAMHDAGILLWQRASKWARGTIGSNYDAEFLVNGMGQGTDVRCHPSPLIQSLIELGLLEPEICEQTHKYHDRQEKSYSYVKAKRDSFLRLPAAKHIYLSSLPAGGFQYISSHGSVLEGDSIAKCLTQQLMPLIAEDPANAK